MEQTLQSIQRLFNRVVGVAHDASAVREQARRIFAEHGHDFSQFEGPAYLRRHARNSEHSLQKTDHSERPL